MPGKLSFFLSLTAREEFGSREILKVLMVRDNVNRLG
jgi:hypothetical protein